MVFTAAAALTSEAGSSPRRATYFLQRESRQSACPCCPRPLRCASGQAAPAPCSCCAAELAPRCALCPNSCRKSNDDAAALCVQPRASPGRRRSRGQKGRGRTRVRDSSAVVLIAATALAERRRGIFRPNSRRPSAPAPDSPLLAAPATAWLWGGWLCRRTQPASLTDSPRLFERNGAAVQRVTRRTPEAGWCRFPRSEAERSAGAQTAGDSFFASLLGCAKREVARRGEFPASEPCQTTESETGT